MQLSQTAADPGFAKEGGAECEPITGRPVSHSLFSPTSADSVLSRRQPTHIG